MNYLFCSYNIVFLAVTYLIPMTAMAFCYSCMGRELWGSKSIGELTHYQRESMKSKRKVCHRFLVALLVGKVLLRRARCEKRAKHVDKTTRCIETETRQKLLSRTLFYVRILLNDLRNFSGKTKVCENICIKTRCEEGSS